LPELDGATPDPGARQTRARTPVDGIMAVAMTAAAAATKMVLRMMITSNTRLAGGSANLTSVRRAREADGSKSRRLISGGRAAARFLRGARRKAIERDALEWATTRGSRSRWTAWQFTQDLAGRLGRRIES